MRSHIGQTDRDTRRDAHGTDGGARTSLFPQITSHLRRIDGLNVAVLILLVAVLAAGVGGSWELEPRDLQRNLSQPTSDLPDELRRLAPDEPAEPLEPRTFDLGWFAVVWRLVFVALLGAGLWWAWRRWRNRPVTERRPMADMTATSVVIDEPELPVLRRGVAEAQRFLSDIPISSDAVVAAWLALEEAATDSGVKRSPAQTPTEFTVDVLERTDADPRATSGLLSLYHRARFSDEPIDADDVAEASRLLGRLAASWDAFTTPDGTET